MPAPSPDASRRKLHYEAPPASRNVAVFDEQESPVAADLRKARCDVFRGELCASQGASIFVSSQPSDKGEGRLAGWSALGSSVSDSELGFW